MKDELPECKFDVVKTELIKHSRSQGKILSSGQIKHENAQQSFPVGGERAKSLDTRKRTRKIIEDEEIDSEEYVNRDTRAFGLIRDHKDPWTSGTYSIGKVLGSGMIGVCCLC